MTFCSSLLSHSNPATPHILHKYHPTSLPRCIFMRACFRELSECEIVNQNGRKSVNRSASLAWGERLKKMRVWNFYRGFPRPIKTLWVYVHTYICMCGSPLSRALIPTQTHTHIKPNKVASLCIFVFVDSVYWGSLFALCYLTVR